jgi:alcohol dehydrogenase (cytochrome c)
MVKPSPQGGANWPPSSFDPESNLLYVCATDRIASYAITLPLEPPVDNRPYFGGSMGQSQAPDRGIFAALDVRTNRLAWRQQWRDTCYSGSVVTRGGLVFVGRADGNLTALDKHNGAKLWEFMTDAGVNSTITTFEHDGEQYVVIHAGGGVFANGKRGDGVWMFSLDGTIEPVVAAGPGGGGPGGVLAGIQATRTEPARPANADNGAMIYREACLPCHGFSGEGGEGGGKSLVEGGLTTDVIMAVTANGRNNMPAFANSYSANELRDVALYVAEVLGRD